MSNLRAATYSLQGGTTESFVTGGGCLWIGGAVVPAI